MVSVYEQTHYVHAGIKVFCLVLCTGYLYDWHVYRGRTDPLTGPDYMYRLIYHTLLSEDIWDHTNACIFFDSAFTTIKLVRDLHDKRGIYAVGPINTTKPAKGAGPNSWPFQKFNNNATKYLQRGWDRVAFSKLGRGGGYLQVHGDIIAPLTITLIVSHTTIHRH